MAAVSIAVLAGAAIASLTVTGHHSRCLALGVSSNYQYGTNTADAEHDLLELEQRGVTSVREDLLWSTVQPAGPREWIWHTYDRLFTLTSGLHLRVLPILGYGTTWASGPAGARAMPTSDTGQLAYSAFVSAVVKRYGPGGTFWQRHPSLAAEPVAAVELWNEPWFEPGASAGTYARLVERAGQAAHRADPDVLVLANVDDRRVTGSPTTAGLWGADVIARLTSLPAVVDVWAMHPYPRVAGTHAADDAEEQIAWLQALLRRRGVSAPIWVTEIGFSAVSGVDVAAKDYGDFTAAMAHTSGPRRVTALWLFTSSRPTPDTRVGSFDYGYNLVDQRGTVSPSVEEAADQRCVD